MSNDERIIELCVGEYFITPKTPAKVNLDKAKQKYTVIKEKLGTVYLRYTEAVEVHLSPGGKTVVIGAESKENALSIFRDIISQCYDSR